MGSEVTIKEFSQGYNTETDLTARLYSNNTAVLIAPAAPIFPVLHGLLALFACALALTILIEVAVAFLYVRAKKIKKKKRILLTVVGANVVSVALLWLVFINFLQGTGFLLGEMFAVVFEGYAVYFFNKKAIKLRSALLMSLIMNLTSLIVGGLVLLSVASFL